MKYILKLRVKESQKVVGYLLGAGNGTTSYISKDNLYEMLKEKKLELENATYDTVNGLKGKNNFDLRKLKSIQLGELNNTIFKDKVKIALNKYAMYPELIAIIKKGYKLYGSISLTDGIRDTWGKVMSHRNDYLYNYINNIPIKDFTHGKFYYPSGIFTADLDDWALNLDTSLVESLLTLASYADLVLNNGQGLDI